MIEVPTPEEDAAITAAALSDPDAQPLTDAELAADRMVIAMALHALATYDDPHLSAVSVERAMAGLRDAVQARAALYEDTK